MTDDRDFDRLARTWLDLGPTEAPDRVVAAVLQAAETTPQARRPFLRSHRRSFPMTRISIAAVAAVLIAVIGGSILLTRGGGPAAGGPVATPTPAASMTGSPSPSSTPLAAEVVGRWMSGPRVGPQFGGTGGVSMAFADDTPNNTFRLGFANNNQVSVYTASASSTGPNAFRLVAGPEDQGGCPDGIPGDYTWSLSPTGRSLTVVGASDPCAQRLAAVAGQWLRQGCKDPSDNCLGDLDAGTYATQFVAPRVKAADSWAPDYGAVTYTVPAGWSNSADYPTIFKLMPTSDYARVTDGSGLGSEIHELGLRTQPRPNTPSDTCERSPVTSVDHTVQGYVDWLRSQPSLAASTAHQITVDGRPAQYVDIGVAKGWTHSCPDIADRTPASVFLTSDVGNSTDTDGISGNEQMRVFVIDIGGGDLAVAWADSSDPARFQELADASVPIIESLHFK